MRPRNRSGNAVLVTLLGTRVQAAIMRRMPERFLPAFVVESMGDDQLNTWMESVRASNKKAVANIFRGVAMSDLPPCEAIASLKMPALILAWEGDRTHPLESARELHRLMPQSELIVAKDMLGVNEWSGKIIEFVEKC